jgi:DNA-binding transcriptional regulator YbjK
MYQKGERRREQILRAALCVIGERGVDAVTHRAVAREAGVPVSATTYYFESREQLLEQSFLLAAREETERLERMVLDLSPHGLSGEQWAEAVAAQIAGDIASEPAKHVALFELGLEATRTPALRVELGRWQEAHVRLAELGCRAVGSDDPQLDARIVVAALTGLMLEQLAAGREDFEAEVLRPVLARLFTRLAAADRSDELLRS